ncbi:MAG: hypothetical protein IPN96_18110 [Anaerolineales bacterium]|nr:hypothetical protein [Anaerolineales bacterium]
MSLDLEYGENTIIIKDTAYRLSKKVNQRGNHHDDYVEVFLLAVVCRGGFVVRYVVQPTTQIGWYAVFCDSTGLDHFPLATNFKKGRNCNVSLLITGSFVIGYITANAVFLAREEKRELPDLIRKDGGDGHTAIL